LEMDWEKLTSLWNGLGKIYKSWYWTGKNLQVWQWMLLYMTQLGVVGQMWEKLCTQAPTIYDVIHYSLWGTVLHNLCHRDFNPLMPNNLLRHHAVSPLKIKIPSKNMHEKPTNTTIIHSVY
jgi:hypothetical protein